MDKKAMQLSINMLVVIIIGIVLFAAGMFLVKKLTSQGDDVMRQVDARLQKQLQQTCFLDGRPICVLDPKAKLAGGDRKLFAFGFMNNLGEEAKFKVIVKSASHPTSINDGKANQMILHTLQIGTVDLEANAEEFLYIGFNPPKGAPSGQYLYDIYVCTDEGSGIMPSESQCTSGTKGLYTRTKQRLFITVI